jgi:hypothetical protein
LKRESIRKYDSARNTAGGFATDRRESGDCCQGTPKMTRTRAFGLIAVGALAFFVGAELFQHLDLIPGPQNHSFVYWLIGSLFVSWALFAIKPSN